MRTLSYFFGIMILAFCGCAQPDATFRLEGTWHLVKKQMFTIDTTFVEKDGQLTTEILKMDTTIIYVNQNPDEQWEFQKNKVEVASKNFQGQTSKVTFTLEKGEDNLMMKNAQSDLSFQMKILFPHLFELHNATSIFQFRKLDHLKN